jgi:hypothetical protein
MRFADKISGVACRYTNYIFMCVTHLSRVHADIGDCQMDSQEVTLKHSARPFFALANSFCTCCLVRVFEHTMHTLSSTRESK